MRLPGHASGLMLMSALLACALERADAQGTLHWTVTFDGWPRMPPGSGGPTFYYYEEGMSFTPIDVGQFGRSGGAVADYFPRNGTAYLYAALGYSLSASDSAGQRFGLVSVDLAEFSTVYQTPLTVRFVGYLPNGSTVMTEFVTDGVIDGGGPLADFETFYFDARFRDLVRVEVPTYGWSLDNMVFSQVPEPGTWALLALGSLLLGATWVCRWNGR